MNRRAWSRGTNAATLGLVVAAMVGSVSCDSDDDGYYYYDPYLYSYYYPAEVAYSSAYWGYDWVYSDWYYYSKINLGDTAQQTDGYGGSGGSSGAPLVQSVGAALRALARNQSVCPGQVTVTPRTGTPVCPSPDRPTAHTGATVVFDNCRLDNGGIVTGTVDVQANHTSSQMDCAAGTTINVAMTTTVTDLSYTSPGGGGRLVIPNQTDTSSVDFVVGTSPASFTVTSSGRMQVYDNNDDVVADTAFNGTRVFTNGADGQSYTIDGMLNLAGQGDDAPSGTVTATGLVRSAACCRPTSGTLVVSLMGGSNPGRRTFGFGPACGAATEDGAALSLPACL